MGMSFEKIREKNGFLLFTFQNRTVLGWPTPGRAADFVVLCRGGKFPLNVCKQDYEIADT